MQPKLTTLLLAAVCCISATVNAQVSEKLQHDVLLLMQEKNERTPAQQKISSQLLQAIRESRGEKMVAGVDLEPIVVQSASARPGYVAVDIYARVSDDLIARLESAGANIVFPSWKYNTIRAEVKLADVETIAAFPEMKFITFGEDGKTVAEKSPQKTAVQSSVIPDRYSAPQVIDVRKERMKAKLAQAMKKYERLDKYFIGSVTSQADATHRAADVRSTYGMQGQGVRIGILSDSYGVPATVATNITAGDLPGPGNPSGNTTAIKVLADITGSDEGRAMLQLVHDLAPKATLFFATANNSQANFATNIQALASAPYNCDIIIDDIYYYAEPVFQDGIIAQAVDAVTAAGVLYLSSAGNEGSVAKSYSGYFEGDFDDTGSPAFTFPGGTKSGTIHNFGTVGSPVNGNIITALGNVYNLNWADAQGASTNDYDLFVVSSAGTIKSSSTTTQNGTQNPYEQITPGTLVAGDRLVVFKTATAFSMPFALNTIRGKLTNTTTGQIHGHTAAAGALSVAATPAATTWSAPTPNGPYPAAFNNTNKVELFTSDGPRRMFLNPDGSAITPGNIKFSTGGGSLRSKPDITAADGTVTTVSGFPSFYGTSAAAPHAGAIAALLKSANPSLTAAQLKTILISTALDIESPGNDNVSGAGIVQAYEAMQAVAPVPTAMLFVSSATTSEGAFATNGNGQVDPNENGTMVIALSNPTPVNATAVTAVLSTTTSGITITQPNAVYGNINSGGGIVSNTATPFAFYVSTSVPCGTLVRFSLTVNFVGGNSPQTFPVTARVGSGGTLINATLGTPPPTGTGFTSTSGTYNTNRITRNGLYSTCAVPKTSPGLTSSATTKAYHAFTFTNNSTVSQCVQIGLDINSITGTGTAASVYTAVYDNTGFSTANVAANFLADMGTSLASNNFSFTAPAGQSFTVVLSEVSPTSPASTYTYSLNVSLSSCQTFTPPLPLTWLDFTATPVNNQVALQWKVANEVNVSRYEVEYSIDGINFNRLYTKAATPMSASDKTYGQLHPFPVAGNNFYRIKQIDLDNRYTYSRIVMVKMGKGNLVTVSPNPASSYVNIQSRARITGIQVFNAGGQLVAQANPGSLSYQLSLSRLPAGQYLLRIESGTEVVNERITKE